MGSSAGLFLDGEISGPLVLAILSMRWRARETADGLPKDSDGEQLDLGSGQTPAFSKLICVTAEGL